MSSSIGRVRRTGCVKRSFLAALIITTVAWPLTHLKLKVLARGRAGCLFRLSISCVHPRRTISHRPPLRLYSAPQI